VADALLILAQAGGGGGLTQFGLIPLLLLIMYFVMIRPQQKQLKEQRNMISALKKGDEILTQSGLCGKIFLVEDKFVTVELPPSNMKVRMLKTSIQGKIPTPSETEEKAVGEEKKEAK
jgi:preprotein translocase subunit YajC